MVTRRELGALGEEFAARWYRERGFEVLARNWRSGRGELDLVCATASVLVVCEVKTRTSSRYGTPLEAITPAKQQQIRRLTMALLEACPQWRRPNLRFDVAAVTPGGATPRVEVLEAAF